MKFGGSFARNIDFEVANFRLLVKTLRERPMFDLQLVKKLQEVSHEILVLKYQHVSSGVSAFAVSLEEAATPFVVQYVKVSKLKKSGMRCLF